MPRTIDTAALELLRAIFDLAEADVRPSLDLLGRLVGLNQTRAKSLVTQLRRAGLVQRERLALTMAGLAVAPSLPSFEPVPMASGLAIREVIAPHSRCRTLSRTAGSRPVARSQGSHARSARSARVHGAPGRE